MDSSSPSLSTISSQSDYDKSPFTTSARPSTDNVYQQQTSHSAASNSSNGRPVQQSAPAGLATSPWNHSPVLPSTPPKDKGTRSRNSSGHSNGTSNGTRNGSPQRAIEMPAQRTVKFAKSPQYAPPSTAAQRRGLDLKARLYDRPQDAQVFQTINIAPRRPKALIETQGNPLPPIPRPPAGNAPLPGGALQTTMFKRDTARMRLKRRGSAGTTQPNGKPRLTRADSIESISSQASSVPGSEVDSSPAEDMYDGHHSAAQSDRASTEASSTAPTSPLVRKTKAEFTPDPSVMSEDGTEYSPASSPTGSSKQDPSVVFSYLKNNQYDDTVPRNDSLTYHVRKMRREMGLVTELPRHGPEVKKQMVGIENQLVEEQQQHMPPEELPEDKGIFVYALPRDRFNPRGRYNPYDLQVVSAQDARDAMTYFTASAESVTLHMEERYSDYDDLTPAMQWMYERRIYHAIHELPVFSQFRIWKAFNVWKNNVRAINKSTGKTIMARELFTANEILQRCLLYIRGQCEAASSSLTGKGTGSKAISLIRVDHRMTITLDGFCRMQAEQCDVAFLQLTRIREKVVKLAWECCAKVAQMEGITYQLEPNSGPLTKKVEPTKQVTGSPKKGEFHKKKGPTYTQMAEWRSILARLSCFLRTADYIILDMLHRLVKTAVRTLLQFLKTSTNTGWELARKEHSESEDDLYSDDDEFIPRKKKGGFSRGVNLNILSDSESPGTTRPNTVAGGDQSVLRFSKTPQTRYNFDKLDDEIVPLDIDQVLEDIRQQEIVEMPPEPVFDCQLVLNVPSATTAPEPEVPKETESRAERRRRKSMSALQKKVVTFHGEEPLSSSSSSSTDNSSEDEGFSEEEGHKKSNKSQRRKKKSKRRGKKDDAETETEDEGQEEEQHTGYAYPEKVDDSSPVPSKPVKTVITLSPNKDVFMSKIRGLISGFEHTVGKFEALQREPYLSVFWSPPRYDLNLSVNEDELEDQSDEKRPWPDLELLFGNDVEYKGMLDRIHMSVHANMENVIEYSQNFEIYCTMVDQARRVNVQQSLSKRVWAPEEFHHVLTTHTEMVHAMKAMETVRRRGMIKVQGINFQEVCLPYPTDVIKALVERLPVIANNRNEDLIKVIKGASKKLDHTPSSVEEFVDHLSFLGRMSAELPSLEREYTVVTRLFTIAKDFDMKIMPEELALYQTLMPSFQHLKSTIIYSEAKKDENIAKFSDDLNAHIQGIQAETYDIRNRIQEPQLLSSDTLAVVAMEKLKLLQDELSALTTRARSYSSYQDRFGSSISNQAKLRHGENHEDYEYGVGSAQVLNDLSEVERDLQLRVLLWEASEEWGTLVLGWTATQFDHLNVDVVQKNVTKFTQTVYMLEKGLPANEVLPRLKEAVFDFKQGMPVITALRNPSLRPRHWQEIQQLIGRHIVRDKNFTLGKFLELQLFQYKDKINDISTQASNEATLEIMLNKVIGIWQSTDFRLIPHTGRDFMILAGADDILAQLEESQVTIATIRGSRYVTPIKALVEEWDRKLNVFSRTLDEWLTCQRNWIYLEQIFLTPDIQRQLASEAKLFASVDKSWKDIMRRTEDRPNALRAATAPGVLEILQTNNSNLDKIHKCLEDYLETKRLVFPRFYFLSNDDLLDILAQSKNPDAVQPHLVKCFGNIKNLEIVREGPRMPATVKTMISAEGERISMPPNVRAREPVEQWLGSVENAMFDTVKRCMKFAMMDKRLHTIWPPIFSNSQNLKEAVHKWEQNLESWVLSHSGQVVLTVIQIMFNRDIVSSLESDHAANALAETQSNLITRLNILANMVTKPLASFQRHSVEALMTIVVHARDILLSIIDKKIYKKDNFEWQKQMRYEWDESHNTCIVQQANSSFQYGYEYLGCSPRLVITPLTDRCYLTLTGALHLHLGGSPAGPAGTGKTETVKDLAKAIGKHCLVFNCSEGLDYKMLGKLFSGLAQAGSWCCFDEFNRIDVEVLSVVAQQLHSIKTAKDATALRFVFEGRDIRLNPTCAVFITMNPSYAGRVELPDNLKSLFRPVSMMVPDYALIAEIMLFSEGFTAAKSLSNKIVNLYQLASKQLSQQDHYDFGMRAIKSVLVMAGQRKRQEQQKMDDPDAIVTEEQESFILIHALRDANLPKFIAEDVPLFESILADLFPGIDPPAPDYGVLEKAISMSIRDLGLQHWPNQVEQVKQLHSQLLVRHGVMLVGPTGGGKTAVRNILQRALTLLPTIHLEDDKERGTQVIKTYGKKGRMEIFNINPKCVKMGELYGETNLTTLEWTDGLLAAAVRRFAKEAVVTATDDGSSERRSSTVMSGTEASGVGGRSSVSGMASPSVVSGTTVSHRGASPHGGSIMTESGLAEENLLLDNKSASEKGGGHGDETPQDWQWLILDGPVDTLWVENLNTVLDDSKLLCLANGERIGLTTGMRLLFEVDNLSQASPATISRCAMVYLDPVDLGWRPYVKTWLHKIPKDFPESAKKHLWGLFEKSVDKGLEFIRMFYSYQHLAATEGNIVCTLCNLLLAFIDFLSKNGGYGTADEERPMSAQSHDSSQSGRSSRSGSNKKMTRQEKKKEKEKEREKERKEKLKLQQQKQASKEWYLQKHPDDLIPLLGKIYVFCFVWSFGGNLKREDDSEDDGGIATGQAATSRPGGKGPEKEVIEINVAFEFDGLVHDLFDTEPPLGIRLPSGSRTIFHYFVSIETGKFVVWDELVSSTKSLIEKGVSHVSLGEQMGLMTQIGSKASIRDETTLVPTVDTVRYSFLASLLLVNKHHVLLTGDSGVGKSALVSHMLKRLTKPKGHSTQHNTILGDVFNYSERGTNILTNIAAITSNAMGDGDDEGAISSLDLTFITGQVRKPTGGLVSTTLQLSAQTTPARVRTQIEHRLMKRGRDTLVGPRGKKVLVFVDDFNLPAPESYGAQPPLELLRQFLELGGFYDPVKLTWKNILDVTLIAACAPLGGGRNPVSPRLLKHFCMLSLPQPSVRSLQHIYQVQLGRFLENNEFLPDVKELMIPLVSASIAIYFKMCVNMLPTPAKSHYTFNVRDLSKVIQGLLQADPTVITSIESAAQLLSHEATRVFHDRLVDHGDRMRFFDFLADDLHNYFKVKWPAQKLNNEPILFGDFLDLNAPSGDRTYRLISDYDKLSTILEDYILRVNYGAGQGSQLVFFNDALEHIVRAARVFRQPGGHMVLVGLDGTGKSTTVQLASHVAGCELYKLTLTRGYNHSDFRDDLKKVFRKAGVQGSNTVFLLTDSDIIYDSFLEDINCVLNSGEVPDLFDNDDMDSIAMDLKRAAAEAEIPDTREAVYEFFLQRMKSHLHVVVATSPAGDAFRQRCRTHPSLVNCCTLDWYDDWSDKAMLRVAHVYLGQVDFKGIVGIQDPVKLKENIARVCVDVHKEVTHQSSKYYEEMRRRYYTTPSSYLDLIRLYSNMLKERKQHFMDNKNRLFVGLSKLSEANSLVDAMQDELVNLGPKIEEQGKDTELLMAQLSKDQEAVDQVRFIVEAEETTMKRETQIVQDYADQAQRDLASVLPALQEATMALDSLDKSDISEIRVYTKPPDLVMHVMGAVCVLMKKKADWSTSKHLLADPGFLKKLVNFDKNSVSDKIVAKLKTYTSMPNFEPEKVGQVSSACKSICQWVMALQHYIDVRRMVKPKQKRVEEAKEALKLAQDSLHEKQASLAKITEHLQVLQKQYDDSVQQRESLRERKILTTLRLKRASVLMSALAGEKIRWAESMEDLEAKLLGVLGDTLISAASIAYLGAFTAPYRRDMIARWLKECNEKEIPVTENFSLISAMAEPNTVRQWQNEGLPQDNHSTENAIFVKKGQRWPLMIDPQGQAQKWICQMEGSALKQVQAKDSNIMRTMESAIRIGEPVLLEILLPHGYMAEKAMNVTEILDPSISPILVKDLIHRGGQDMIKLGDTEIEYNHNFRLYMTTSMPNPHFLPAVCIRVTLINFTVTFEGLQDQLLSTVVQQEQPLLEKQRGELLESIAGDMTMLRDLEDKSLTLLQKSEGHILDDQDLVDTLDKSKKMSGEIEGRVGQSEDTQKSIELARKKYLPVATRGAVLYFVIADLAGIDVMYQFSLAWFQDMFTSCIKVTAGRNSRPSSGSRPLSGRIRPSSARNSPDFAQNGRDSPLVGFESSKAALLGKELTKHLVRMVDNLTESIYRVVSKALFAHHQLVFSFMLCTKVMRSNAQNTTGPADVSISQLGSITESKWQIFLQGNVLAASTEPALLEKHDGLTPLQRLEAESKGGGSRGSSSKSRKVNSAVSDRTPANMIDTKPSILTGNVTSIPPKWIPDNAWKQCQYLSANEEGFEGLCMFILNCRDQWHVFSKHPNPSELMMTPFKSKFAKADLPPLAAGEPSLGNPFKWEVLEPFERLILIRVLRPDCLVNSVRNFIDQLMGSKFLSSGEFDLREVFEESSAKHPLIFIMSPGVDPTAQLIRFAREQRGSTLHLDLISLGRGQGPKAEELIAKAQILKGRWVFLQNCHLAASFMPRLQAIVEGFNKPNSDVDPQFRLWLSSKPDPCFPVSILQTGMKVTVESPQGLKANLLRSLGSGGAGSVTEKMWDDSTPGPEWKSLLFGLCFFNAIINERRKYGALGWNIPYEFSASDLEVSIQLLQMLLLVHKEPPWEALRYLTGEVVYGGRVTDSWDRRCLLSILNTFYCPKALLPQYSYSPDKVYHPLPRGFSLSESRTYIEGLPDSDSPEVFGMDPNAEKAFRESEAASLMETVMSVQPRLAFSLMGTGKSGDNIVLELMDDIQQRIPHNITGEEDAKLEAAEKAKHDKVSATNAIFSMNFSSGNDFNGGRKRSSIASVQLALKVKEPQAKSALLTVLRQEVDRFNRLLSAIHTSLASLGLAVKGEIVMSEQLEEMYKAILSQKVPKSWQQVSYESCKPLGSWVTDLQHRVDFFSKWNDMVIEYQENQLKMDASGMPVDMNITPLRQEPRSFWLPAFFFPQGFLTAVLQNHSRQEGISVDELIFDFKIMMGPDDTNEALSNVKEHIDVKGVAFKGPKPPNDGVLVFGLFLDGARFDADSRTIQDSRPEERFCRLPEVYFQPTKVSQDEVLSSPTSSASGSRRASLVASKEMYTAPLYRTSQRAGMLSSTGHSTNFVTAISLPSNLPPDVWITRGVALLCQLDH